jgi:hypothetical protein
MPPPGPGGGGGGGGRRGARTPHVREGNEDVRKFLSFYKRRNSVCVDLYLPAFYQKKPSYDDLAEFVYSVLSVGGTSSPQVIQAGVQDIQLHPVKKLLFIKFTEQQLRDEVAVRLQAGLVWPAFDTTVTGWSMDKPVERIRVLGTSPETDQAGIRRVMGQYGEILDCQKGFISKKLPGCTNGIWTVKLLLKAGMSLPPFLIMKDEGEVWQLATGESSVCWKCGKAGHIGDKCRQDVNVLAESIASPAVGDQPSWAHVVKGGVSVVPPPPLLPPPVPANPQLFRNPYKATSAILIAAKAALKVVVPEVSEPAVQEVAAAVAADEHSYVLANPPSPAMEISVDAEDFSVLGNTSGVETQFSQPKKAKLSENLNLRDQVPNVSPVLHHKTPVRSSKDDDSEDSDEEDECRDQTNLFGVNFIMWFEVGIEGKDPMDQEEEDWGGRVEFGYQEKGFPTEMEDYFLLFEDKCSQSHTCAGRIMGIQSYFRDKVLKPPSYDPRDIVALVEKYGDAHISDSGWRAVDQEEWYAES